MSRVDQDIVKTVYRIFQRCFQNTINQEGSRVVHALTDGSFLITKTEESSPDHTRYHFRVQGRAQTDFMLEEPRFELLSGYVVLNTENELVIDEQSQACFGPYLTLPAIDWTEPSYQDSIEMMMGSLTEEYDQMENLGDEPPEE